MPLQLQIISALVVLIPFGVWIFGARIVRKGSFLAVLFLGDEYAIKKKGLRWVPPLGTEEETLPTTQQKLEIELPPVLPAPKEQALYPGEKGTVRKWSDLTQTERDAIDKDPLSQQVPVAIRATLLWRYNPDEYFTFRENVGHEQFESKIREAAQSALHDELGLITVRTAIMRKPELGRVFAKKVRIIAGAIPDPDIGESNLSWGLIFDSGFIGPITPPTEVTTANSRFAAALADAQARIATAGAEEERLRREGKGRADAVDSLREVMEKSKGTDAAALDTTRQIFQGSEKTTIVAPGIGGTIAGVREVLKSVEEQK